MITIRGRAQRGSLALEFDLDIAAGVSYVTGPNGAGKTTLLRIIAGLEALDTGELRIGDTIVDDPDQGVFVPAHERPVSLAFQDHRLFPHLSVIDNVAFSARRRGATRIEARAGAEQHLHAVGMDTLADHRPGELSIGQRQRTSLARSLAKPAEVLLLDEPLASVDEVSRSAIRRHLRTTDHQATVWVTHDPDDLSDSAPLISLTDGSVRQTLVP